MTEMLRFERRTTTEHCVFTVQAAHCERGRILPSGCVAARLRLAVLGLTGMVFAGQAQADAWSAFQARCLDAYEVLTEPVVDGLDRITPVISPEDYSANARVFGTAGSEDMVILDPTPVLDGDRSCSVVGDIDDRFEIARWVAEQVRDGRYDISRDGAATVLVSREWIEPRLQVTLVLEGLHAGTYSVLETYLES